MSGCDCAQMLRSSRMTVGDKRLSLFRRGILKDVFERPVEHFGDSKSHLQRRRLLVAFDCIDRLSGHSDLVCQRLLGHRKALLIGGVKDWVFSYVGDTDVAHQQRGTTVSSVLGGQNALFEGQREITTRGMADGAVTSRSNQKHNIISC